MTDLDEALRQHECVLVKDGKRRVIMLDGRTVIDEGPGGTGPAKAFTEDAAVEAFKAAIERLRAEGWVIAKRDVKVERAVRSTPPPPSPKRQAVKELAPAPTPRVQSGTWEVHGSIVTLPSSDLGSPDDLAALNAADLSGADHLDFYVFGTPQDSVDAIGLHGLPRWARALTLASFESIEDFIASELDVTAVWPALREVEWLDLRAGHLTLPTTGSARCTRLDLTEARSDGALVAALREGAWPALKSLRIWAARVDEAGLDAMTLAPLLERAWPSLRSLSFQATSDTDALVEALAKSSLLPQLEVISFAYGALTASGVEALLAHADRFRHLTQLDLAHAKLPSGAEGVLGATLPNLATTGDGVHLSRGITLLSTDEFFPIHGWA